MHWLSLSIWLPVVCGALLLTLGKPQQAGLCAAGPAGGGSQFVVTLPLITGFDTGSAALQFGESLKWIERFNVRYALGVDGISVWFVLLTAFITVIVVVAGWEGSRTASTNTWAPS